MNPLISRFAAWFCCSLFLLSSWETRAEEGKDISAIASRNGTITLEITNRSPNTDAFSAPRDYSIRYSTDLEHWTEIGRVSSHEVFDEIRHLQSKGESHRFYKAERVELSPASLIQINSFVEVLESYNEYASGIVLEGITLADITAFREAEDALRAQLQELIDNHEQLPDGLAALYYQLLAETDEMLSANPLEIKIDDTVLEIEVSEAMRVISEEYQRLGLVSLNDYDRLPGITPSDIEGLEMLIEHFNRRQVGIETSIPIFESLSPFGNFTLVDRLIRKYGDILLEQITDFDNDGKLEINYELFRGLINGGELTSREAAAIISEISDENPLPWDAIVSPTISNESLNTILTAIEVLERKLELATETLVLDKSYEDVFEELIFTNIRAQLQSYHKGTTTSLTTHIRHPSIPLELLPEVNLPSLSAPPTTTELSQFETNLSQWNLSIRESVSGFLDNSELSENLEDSFKSILSDKLNGYRTFKQHIFGLYQIQFNTFTNTFNSTYNNSFSHQIIAFDLPNGNAVEINFDEHPVLASLPFEISKLLKYSGIASKVNEEELLTLLSREDWWDKARVSFSSDTQTSSGLLSDYGRNVELLGLLLQHFGNETITAGDFDSTIFARLILINPELEALIDSTEQAISTGLDRIENIDINLQPGLSKDEYRDLLDILESAKLSIQDSSNETLEQLDFNIRRTFEAVLQGSYDLLNVAIDAILEPGVSNDFTEPNLKIVINQTAYTVPIQTAFSALSSQLDRITVVADYDQPTRRQYLRLNGVTEALALDINPNSHRGLLRNLWLSTPHIDSDEPLDLKTDPYDAKRFLLPTILETFGQEILNNENEVDLSIFKQKLLHEVYTPVQEGLSIKIHNIQLATNDISQAQSELRPLNLNTWEGRLEAERIYESMEQRIVESVVPLIKELEPSEIQTLERNRFVRSKLNNLHHNYINLDYNLRDSDLSLTMQDGEKFTVPLREIKAIPSFPYSPDFWDQKLFVGIEESDIENSKLLSSNIRYTKSGEIDEEDRFQGFSRDKLIANLLTRYYNDPQFELTHSKEHLFKDGKISVEVFRRIIKGIDALHREVLAQTRLMTNEALEKLESLTKAPLTLENALAVFTEATDLQNSIVEYLTSLTSFHEREDVIEMEEAVTAIYKDIIDDIIDYYRGNELVIDADGTLVTVPVQQISDELVKLIEARFPGEGIDAHHFAAIAGISVEDLREYNKLGEFLGAQIIALPRNSQFVEIQSKLSEIGFMQMARDAIMRHFDEVVDVPGNQIDIDSLLALLMDTDLGFDSAIEIAQSIHDEATEKLNAIQNLNTLNGFEKALKITNDFKLETRNRVNDHISYFTSEQLTEIQVLVDQLFQDFIASRDAQLIGLPITIETVDRQTYTVNLSEIENSVVERLKALVLANPQPEPDDQPIFGYFPGIDERIAQPWPTPQLYNPDHTLTQLGFHILMARLIESCGITVSENGAFSLDKFIEELGKPNNERSEELFESLKTQAISNLEAKFPEGENPIDHQDILAINTFLNEERTRFYSMLDQLNPSYGRSATESPGKVAWLAVMNRYEDLLFNRDFTFQLNNQTLTVPTASLVNLMNQNYDDGHTDLLDSSLIGGESLWIYQNFKNLYIRIDYSDYFPTTNFSPEIENGQQIDTPRYSFNLGDLSNVPGITIRNLSDLEHEQTHQIEIEQIPANQLLTAQFNLRILNPGSQIQTIGRTSSVTEDFSAIGGPNRFGNWYTVNSFLDLSPRDIRFRLLVELIQTYAEILVDSEGNIDLEAFEILLQTEIE
jgi:hypothetical protein